MKRRAWRIVRDRHAASAFDGEGARLFGGRWNSPGTPVVYTSGTMALAALETLVHLNPPLRFRCVSIEVAFDDALVEAVNPSTLPSDWCEEPPPPSSQAIGDLWVRKARSAVLEIPSVIIPSETNYLINPKHPDFRKIHIGKPVPFAFDSRLI